ncbi:MAG: hypothetical protein JO324_06110 [Candidatus Eremiobacteraeota bacterium]|nr:hypothetical protein [Candidatus Eremiobacteraeota bacterium]
MAIDHKHNIYVSDNGNSRIVVLNEAGSQIAVLSDPGETPEDVAVAPNGTVGVTNRYNVVFYAKGSSVITSTACCLLSEYQYGAFDKSGNFYADGFDASLHVTVEEVVNAAGGGTNETDTGYGNTIGFPGGIAIDKMDTLDVVDEHCLCVYQFPSGNKITLDNVVTPTAIALQKDDAEIAVADYSANGSVIFYAYPAGGAPIFYANNADYPDGVVINPGWQY